MIKEIQSFWAESEKKRIKTVAEQFHLSLPCAKKYIYMSSKELEELDTPKNYKKRESAMNEWLNVIFKMMLDGHTNETIYFYIKEHPDFNESEKKLQKYIYLIGKNNFPDRIPFNANYLMEKVLPPDVICFKRTEILKYLLTCNPKKQKDLELGKYIDVIKEAYPVAAYVETVFKDFHRIIMGNSPDEIDVFIEQYEESVISTFCKGLKKDIAPVKNAISHRESSGFVEGNNNKFKLIKRILYGRSKIVNLFRKCYLPFLMNNSDFQLMDLLHGTKNSTISCTV